MRTICDECGCEFDHDKQAGWYGPAEEEFELPAPICQSCFELNHGDQWRRSAVAMVINGCGDVMEMRRSIAAGKPLNMFQQQMLLETVTGPLPPWIFPVRRPVSEDTKKCRVCDGTGVAIERCEDLGVEVQSTCSCTDKDKRNEPKG